VFQWVVCELEMFKGCLSEGAIKQQMSSLAKGLDETYDQILGGMVECMKTLQALIVTVYPLCLEEVLRSSR